MFSAGCNKKIDRIEKEEIQDAVEELLGEGSYDESDSHKVVIHLSDDRRDATEAELKPVYETECKEIILDCTQLEYIASSGLRLFLNMLIDTKPQGKHLVIKGMTQPLRDVFDITGFTNLFEFI